MLGPDIQAHQPPQRRPLPHTPLPLGRSLTHVHWGDQVCIRPLPLPHTPLPLGRSLTHVHWGDQVCIRPLLLGLSPAHAPLPGLTSLAHAPIPGPLPHPPTPLSLGLSLTHAAPQLGDMWRVVSRAPSEARRWDREVGLTATVTDFGKGGVVVAAALLPLFLVAPLLTHTLLCLCQDCCPR